MDAPKREKIEIRVTRDEKDLVRAAAEKAGVSISTWLLRSAKMDDIAIDHEPRRGVYDATKDEALSILRDILRELRGELAVIRTRLDGLVAIERQLGYYGQRMEAIEKRFATLVQTTLDGPTSREARRVSPPAKPA
jgi:hypothetical protein